MLLPSMWKNVQSAFFAADWTARVSRWFGRNHKPPLRASSSASSASTAMLGSLFADATEMIVVVVGVVELTAGSPYDTPRAARSLAGRLHRVLAIVAPPLARQDRLAVGEDGAVARVRERAALADQCHGGARLRRKLRDRDL